MGAGWGFCKRRKAEIKFCGGVCPPLPGQKKSPMGSLRRRICQSIQRADSKCIFYLAGQKGKNLLPFWTGSDTFYYLFSVNGIFKFVF